MEETQAREYARGFSQVVARAWTDEEFKARLLAEPADVLRENGIDVKPGAEVRVLEDTDKVVHVGLPPRPDDELADEALEAVAGGGSTASTAGSAGTVGTISCPAGSVGSAFCAGSAGTLGPS